MLELYQAYGDYRSMMDLTEGLIVACVDCARRRPDAPVRRARRSNFTPPFQRAKYADLFREHVGCAMADEVAVRAAARAANIALELEDDEGRPRVAEGPRRARPRTVRGPWSRTSSIGPVFVYDYPAALCPLTKRKRDNPAIAERFELYVHGMELANAYTELNDPITQEATFRQQLAGLPEEDSMAKMDDDFVRALRHGMPPAGGLGIGIDRLVMLLTNTPDDPRRDPVPAAAAGGEVESRGTTVLRFRRRLQRIADITACNQPGGDASRSWHGVRVHRASWSTSATAEFRTLDSCLADRPANSRGRGAVLGRSYDAALTLTAAARPPDRDSHGAGHLKPFATSPFPIPRNLLQPRTMDSHPACAPRAPARPTQDAKGKHAPCTSCSSASGTSRPATWRSSASSASCSAWRRSSSSTRHERVQHQAQGPAPRRPLRRRHRHRPHGRLRQVRQPGPTRSSITTASRSALAATR